MVKACTAVCPVSGGLKYTQSSISYYVTETLTRLNKLSVQIFPVGMRTYERSTYTCLDLLGDFGGFNDGIYLIAGFLMRFYSSKMYQAAVSQDFSPTETQVVQ